MLREAVLKSIKGNPKIRFDMLREISRKTKEPIFSTHQVKDPEMLTQSLQLMGALSKNFLNAWNVMRDESASGWSDAYERTTGELVNVKNNGN